MPQLPPAVKRLISIAFVAALVFGGARVFQVDSAKCELVFRFREAPPAALVEIGVRLYGAEGATQEEESLGEFRKYYNGKGTGPVARWPLVIAGGTYRLQGEIITRAGTSDFEVEVTLVDGEAQSVYLDRFLRIPKNY